MTHRITFLRKRLGLSQIELGERVGLAQSAIANVELGKRSLKAEEMEPFALALECHVLDLLPLSVMADIADDVEIADSPRDPPIEAAMAAKGLVRYKVIRDAVSAAGVAAGSTLVGDTSSEAVTAIRDGDMVVADVTIPTESVRGRVLRQFLQGGLLTTNRPGRNVSFNVKDPDYAVAIVAVVMRGPASH